MIEEVEVQLPADLDPFFILGIGKESRPELHFYEGGENAPPLEAALEMLNLLSEKLFERLGGDDRDGFLKGFKSIHEGLKIKAISESKVMAN